MARPDSQRKYPSANWCAAFIQEAQNKEGGSVDMDLRMF
jgi:hypothetical protein